MNLTLNEQEAFVCENLENLVKLFVVRGEKTSANPKGKVVELVFQFNENADLQELRFARGTDNFNWLKNRFFSKLS